ncbi:MAG: glutamate--tRNA ligase [Bacteroidota bacterium]|nr:glutamate--tRNA ligase [Bacteroidota bacterium]
MKNKVRVRFAPSPTGPLHIGGVRTALFNYLFAKKHGGDFLLRIEDTDQTRFVQGAEEYINKSLAWCGMTPDEGVNEGGDYGPYKQSERKDLYQKYAKQLIENGHAYYAFDTAEELDAMRQRLTEAGSSVRQYNVLTRGEMKNSYTLSDEEVKQRIDSGKPYVIRFNIPADREVELKDIVRGTVRVNTKELDDKVLFKSDGLPTYHLANIVDDYLMEISHVIRGEEWLPSLPLHYLLYEALGWEDEMPEFAHLPLILKPNGKGKLSKRDGEKMGFPVFPLEWKDPETGDISAGFKEDGYLQEAFINLLALMGWSPGTDEELLSMDYLISSFELERVAKGGAKFSPDKAKWYNEQYLKNYNTTELAELYEPLLEERGIKVEDSYLTEVLEQMRERISFLPDLFTEAEFFFKTPEEYNPKVVKKRWKAGIPEHVQNVHDALQALDAEDFSTEKTEEAVKKYIQDNDLGFGKILNPIRLLLTGTGGGPHLFDIMAMIGKAETLLRLENGIKNIPSK